MMPEAVGMVELSSIGMGFQAEDTMLKEAGVALVVARTICSGKYVVIVKGDVSAVQASVEAGLIVCPSSVIDSLIIPNVHPQVFPAISGTVELQPDRPRALGIVETFSAASAIEAGDAAVKEGDVDLFRIHLAMAIGGKGFLQVTGDVDAVRAAVNAGVRVASARGLLVSQIVIPAPREELFREFI
ncbi:MAG: BMC domain-containing protein [bacterium]